MHGNWPCTVLLKILSKNQFDDNVYAPQNIYIVYSHTITIIFCICQLPVRFLEQQMCVNRPCFVFSSFSKNTLDKTVLQLKLDIHPFSWHKAWVNTFLFLTTKSVWWSGNGGSKQDHYLISQIYAGWGGGLVDGLLVPSIRHSPPPPPFPRCRNTRMDR